MTLLIAFLLIYVHDLHAVMYFVAFVIWMIHVLVHWNR